MLLELYGLRNLRNAHLREPEGLANIDLLPAAMCLLPGIIPRT